MHPLLASYMQDWKQQTPYSQSGDWVFASSKLKGRQPRVANMLVSDYIRPAAANAGVLQKDNERRFGFHNLRHSLATFLIRVGTNPKPYRLC
jgi:integrase